MAASTLFVKLSNESSKRAETELTGDSLDLGVGELSFHSAMDLLQAGSQIGRACSVF